MSWIIRSHLIDTDPRCSNHIKKCSVCDSDPFCGCVSDFSPSIQPGRRQKNDRDTAHSIDNSCDNHSVGSIQDKLKLDYTYLSNIFSEVKGITIQQYIIIHKIEKVKELLLYDELNLTEISYKLDYSSVAHLSSQFKKITGLTPTYFKSLKQKRISTLENL